VAVAIETRTNSVVTAAASAYQRMGQTVVVREMPLQTIFPESDPIEVVVNDRVDLLRSITYVADLVADGQVTVLVPTALTGDAHSAYRDLSDSVRIQPWWTDDMYSVQFGRPEIP
jgi:hypothetical protein